MKCEKEEKKDEKKNFSYSFEVWSEREKGMNEKGERDRQ